MQDSGIREEEQTMLLLDKIQATSFSPGEQSAVDFMLEQKEDIRDMTVKEIAAAAYCAPSTLIRVAHKLGFEGWSALKESFLEETEYLSHQHSGVDANFPFFKGDTDITISENLAVLECESIMDTLSMLDAAQLHKATMMLRHAKIIYILTAYPNHELTGMFREQMLRIGRTVVVVHQPLYAAWLMTPEDCAIILSYSGETGLLVEAARILNERKVPFISISNVGETTLARRSQATLKLCTREKLYSKIGSFSSEISVFYLLHVLYACLFESEYDRNVERKLGISRRVEARRHSTTSLLQEEEPEDTENR